MELYLKQRVFSWTDRFTVYDAAGSDLYHVEGEFFSWGKKLHILEPNGRETAFIHQKVFSFLPRYYISRGGADVAEVVKAFTFFHQRYDVAGLDWTAEGDFWAHEYAIHQNGQQLAAISKKWFSWGDAYEIHIENGIDPVNVLAVVLVIDACLESAQNNGN